MLLFHSQKISQKPENYKEMSLEHISLAFVLMKLKRPGSFESGPDINKVVCFLQRLGNYLFSIFPLSFKNTACS